MGVLFANEHDAYNSTAGKELDGLSSPTVLQAMELNLFDKLVPNKMIKVMDIHFKKKPLSIRFLDILDEKAWGHIIYFFFLIGTH